MKGLVALSLLALSSVAVADQCAITKREYVARASVLLQPGSQVIEYFSGDVKKAEIQIVKKIETRKSALGEGIVINDSDKGEIDLAYTYIKVAHKTFANVAKIVGCPVGGVNNTLER